MSILQRRSGRPGEKDWTQILFALLIGFAGFGGNPSAATSSFGQVTSIQVPSGLEIFEVLQWDVDGDGAPELIVSARNGSKRVLRIHHRIGVPSEKGKFQPCYGSRPDRELELTGDVIAFAVADVGADSGNEIVLYGAEGVYAWRPEAPERDRFARLLPAEFLWQIPDRKGAFAFPQGVVRVDGDDHVDLVVPEPEGYRVGVQARVEKGVSKFGKSYQLRLPEPREPALFPRRRRRGGGMRESGGRSEFSVSFDFGGDGGSEDSALLEVDDRIPSPHLVDWDGDGDRDLVVQTARDILVWLQDDRGGFPEDPALRRPNPVVVDEERRLDVSYSSHVLDFDLDRRIDAMFLAGDKRTKDFRTQVLVFLQAASKGKGPFLSRGIPNQLLVLQGFAGRPHFRDVDGDGLPDLSLVCLRPDLIDQIRSAGADSLEGELTVFLNRKSGFSKRPDLVHRVRITPGNDGRVVRFFGDITGDGVSELLVREEKEVLKIYTLRSRRGALRLIDRPIFELAIPETARVIVAPDLVVSREAPELLITAEDQVLHVRFP